MLLIKIDNFEHLISKGMFHWDSRQEVVAAAGLAPAFLRYISPGMLIIIYTIAAVTREGIKPPTFQVLSHPFGMTYSSF